MRTLQDKEDEQSGWIDGSEPLPQVRWYEAEAVYIVVILLALVAVVFAE